LYHGRKTELLFGRLVDAWTGERSLYGGIEPYVREVRCPVLAIQGAEDEFFTRAQVDALRALVPAPVDFSQLAGCGHAPHRQAAAAVVTAAARFIARLTSDARMANCGTPDEQTMRTP